MLLLSGSAVAILQRSVVLCLLRRRQFSSYKLQNFGMALVFPLVELFYFLRSKRIMLPKPKLALPSPGNESQADSKAVNHNGLKKIFKCTEDMEEIVPLRWEKRASMRYRNFLHTTKGYREANPSRECSTDLKRNITDLINSTHDIRECSSDCDVQNSYFCFVLKLFS